MGTILEAIVKMKRPVFTTGEIHALRGGSRSSLVQSLRLLEKQGVVIHISRGLWMVTLGDGIGKTSPYALAQHLILGGPSYISFTSALHLHGIIGQIPQSITVASTTHTRTIRTSLGAFFIHRIAPSFFCGYDWYKGSGSFLVASPEKALVDCLYVSSRRNKQFSHFPELDLSQSFGAKRAREWVQRIADFRIRSHVRKKLGELLSKGSGT
jgi:predicted transcriptional regulator of viral defense system